MPQRKKKTPSKQKTSKTRAGQAIASRQPAKLTSIPVTFQEISDYFRTLGEANPFALRKETLLRIERITGSPLLCHVTKTHNIPQGLPTYIDNSDLIGFDDLTHSIEGDAVDIFLVSNGGSPEATERIVSLLRERFRNIRFIIPANAYSAATLMCFSGDEIIMSSIATLGPIDPQINGVPARAILRAFETIEERLKNEGPQALAAYMPLISKYDLHILEICKSAQELSEELARNWLAKYMLNRDEKDPEIAKIVDFFSSYDIHKSHGRSIDRSTALSLGLKVINVEDIDDLSDLVCSLYNQYEFWFDKTPFYKMFENAHGINWGRQAEAVTVQLPLAAPPGAPLPPPAAPQPGPPERSD